MMPQAHPQEFAWTPPLAITAPVEVTGTLTTSLSWTAPPGYPVAFAPLVQIAYRDTPDGVGTRPSTVPVTVALLAWTGNDPAPFTALVWGPMPPSSWVYDGTQDLVLAPGGLAPFAVISSLPPGPWQLWLQPVALYDQQIRAGPAVSVWVP